MALKGIRVIELVGLAPAPFCGLILSDFGAKVLRIDNPNAQKLAMLDQGKDTMYLDLKDARGVEILRKLIKHQSTDVLLEPFRPGVLERLQLGPDQLCRDNSRLIYARLSGYGQTGPLAKKAGHDINYLSNAGVLSRMGHADRPPIGPMNLLADFGGGSLVCALGIVMALYEREYSGQGQIVDSSITEGTAYLSSFLWETLKQKEVFWPQGDKRGSNLLDFGAPFYRCYRTKDDKFMAVGALEGKFYDTFKETIGLDGEELNQFDVNMWPEQIGKIESIFASKTQEEWTHIFEGLDCCVTPVLEAQDAHKLDQHQQRSAFDENGMPKPAPILSRTPAARLNQTKESCTEKILIELNYAPQEIQQLREDEIID